MPRPSKRALSNREKSVKGVEAAKRRRLSPTATALPTEAPDTGSEGDSESDSDKEVELSDPEDDILELKQPALGWVHAERQLPGYSKTNTGKTRQSKWYQKNKKAEQEKKTEELQRTYGDISRWFNPLGSTTATGPPIQTRSPTPPALPEAPPPLWLLPPSPSPPALPEAAPPPLWLLPPSGPSILSPPSHSPSPPKCTATSLDFESTFFRTNKLTNEIHDLEAWLKKNKAKVTGDWLKRVQGIIGLLRFHGSKGTGYNTAAPEKRRHDWVEHSVSVAVSFGKGQKYAQALRRWERDWFETRTPPACPQRGRHVKRTSLFNDEGVSLAVREYLNVAMWRADPQGMCEAVKNHLRSEEGYDLMKIEVILNNKDNKGGISDRTARRWFVKLGWIYGRNKKGYCDGHEREDVVEYRDKVFCPRMKVCGILRF
jgi:hypothetical protein